jgi:hypothetical protein
LPAAGNGELAPPAVARDEPEDAIERLREKIDRFIAGHHHAAFMATEEGLLVAHPIGVAAASRLKTELETLQAEIRRPRSFLRGNGKRRR